MGLKQFELKGKIAMVTGSTRGLGEVAALALAKAGADIAVSGRSAPDLERVTAAIQGLGQKARGFNIDVTDKNKVFDAVAQILEHFGRIDILVNDAGVNYRVPVLEFPEEEWDRIIGTNLKGYFLTAQAVAPQMITNGYGKIINMSSILGTVGLPNQVAYAASKGGVDQMTKVMALEWAKLGVRVNAVGPTYFETELVTQIREDPERFDFINERTPMGRWGQPEDIAGPVLFLASTAAAFMTGTCLAIDGGYSVA